MDWVKDWFRLINRLIDDGWFYVEIESVSDGRRIWKGYIGDIPFWVLWENRVGENGYHRKSDGSDTLVIEAMSFK